MSLNYGMEIMRATEIAALTASRMQGSGNMNTILNHTREALFKTLNRITIDCCIKNDRFAKRTDTYQFPDTVGQGGDNMDVIAMAIEGHHAVSSGRSNSISCAAITPEGGIRHVPNLSMFKMVVGQQANGVIDIQQPPSVNIKRVARALKKYTESITVCIPDHARHYRLIHEVQNSGARIKLISEGEVSGCLAAIVGRKVDIFMGYGFTPEGVMTAAAVKCLGGYFEGKIAYENDRDKELARTEGIEDFEKIFKAEDLILTNDVAFAATGITDGKFLEGVDFTSTGAITHSFIARGESKTYRNIETHHFFDYKPVF